MVVWVLWCLGLCLAVIRNNSCEGFFVGLGKAADKANHMHIHTGSSQAGLVPVYNSHTLSPSRPCTPPSPSALRNKRGVFRVASAAAILRGFLLLHFLSLWFVLCRVCLSVLGLRRFPVPSFQTNGHVRGSFNVLSLLSTWKIIF